eukprot:TRINITY_DN6973_c0_g1_i1.p1 TRINITY_DN6973_c0_g1~~TRINITY_DN6973_c0_g1_i1.p1  ORF type:complete len:262 (-),score=55.65 TRINITY_DN6973_c0_g1_i1:649-1434(-)
MSDEADKNIECDLDSILQDIDQSGTNTDDNQDVAQYTNTEELFSLTNTLPDTSKYNLTFKIIVVGDSAVGKTNILSRWVDDKFRSTEPTLSVELACKVFQVEDNVVKVQLWDTAGQEQFRSVASSYYRRSHGAIVVYDITRADTFESLDRWIDDVKSAQGNEEVQILLVGNKSDLEESRQISTEDGVSFARKHNINFLETSALNGKNVHKAFQIVLQDIYILQSKNFNSQREIPSATSKPVVDLSNSSDKTNESTSCCTFF